MFKLSIGDTIYLANDVLDSSVIGKVTSYTVGKDINGEELILTVHLEGITSFKLAKSNSWNNDKDIWTVDEVNGSAPKWTMPELEAIGELIEQFPTIRK
jgi:hypothetical protein